MRGRDTLKLPMLISTRLHAITKAEVPAGSILLGSWCRAYDAELQLPILPYHWENRDKLSDDYNEINKRYEEFLYRLAILLNKKHSVNYSLKYWRVLVGPWLLLYMQIMFDRWESVRIVALSGEFFSNVHNDEILEFVALDTSHFTLLSHTDSWNHIVFREIMKRFSSITLQTPMKFKNSIAKVNLEVVRGRRFRFIMHRLISILSSVMKKHWDKKLYVFQAPNLADAVRRNSVIKRGIIRLHDKIINPRILSNNSLWTEFRNQALDWPVTGSFERFAMQMLPRFLPKIYLEDYAVFSSEAHRGLFPRQPSKILTSNSVYYSEMFKFWCADKVDSGVPLYIYQHGGGYGAMKVCTNEDHECAIADKFVSWGWSKLQSNVVPFGYCRSARIKLSKNRDNIVLVMTGLPRYSHKLASEPQSSNFERYLDDHIKLITGVKKSIRSKIVVRPPSLDYGWGIKERLSVIKDLASIDDRSQNLSQLYSSAKVVIHTSNSTTFLETINSDIPTLVLLNSQFYEIRDDAESLFGALSNVGVLHYSVESLSLFLNNINSIDKWWNATATKIALNRFKSEFCKDCENEILEL